MAAPLPSADDAPVVEVRRSRKRRRTVAAYREDDKVVVLVPARFTRAEEKEWVATMLARLERSEKRRRPSDAGLMRRAAELTPSYLDGRAEPGHGALGGQPEQPLGQLHPERPGDPAVHRLQGMPPWVIDYVLVHELAHLIEAGHTPAFWAWVDRYPKAERAKGFLEGVAAASQLGIEADAAGLLRRGRGSDGAPTTTERRPSEPPARASRRPASRSSAAVGRQGVDRPPAHVERLLADLVGGARGRHGQEAHVEVAHRARGRRRSRPSCASRCSGTGSSTRPVMPDSSARLPQRGAGQRGVVRLAVAAEVEPAPCLARAG